MSLSDFDLKNYIRSGRLTINPLYEDTIQQNGIDLHIGPEIALPKGRNTLDLARDETREFFRVHEVGSRGFEIPPFTSVLLHTEEYIKLPTDLVAVCGLRSTFARLGFISPTTYVDAGFEGQLTIETFWAKSHPIKVYRGIRFLHVIFVKCLNSVEKPYSGIYQEQRGVRLPKTLIREVEAIKRTKKIDVSEL